MKILFGAGENAIHYIHSFGHEKLVCYDNDRRKWGTKIEGISIIDLNDFLKLANSDNEIIVTTKNENAIYFLADACPLNVNVYKYDLGELVPISLSDLGEYRVNVYDIEKRKMVHYEEAKSFYKQNKMEKAYQHACQFIEYKEKHLNCLELGGIELTNFCNLSCKNCPTPTCKRKKGYMDRQTFQECLKYIAPDMESFFSLHGLGEPLLHPLFFECLQEVVSIQRPMLVSTNGILLNEENIDKLFTILNQGMKGKVYVSFHSRKSVENWNRCVSWIRNHKNNKVELYGQVLEHNIDEAYTWLYDLGIVTPEKNQYIRHISSHSFAGNVESRKKVYSTIEVKNRYRNCYYNINNVSNVAWDGRLKTCCLDSELEGNVGTIFEFDKAQLNHTGYKLCNSCDPDWTSCFQ